MSENGSEELEPLEEPEPALTPDEEEQHEEAQEEETAVEQPEEEEPAEPTDLDRERALKAIDKSFNTYKAAIDRNLPDEVNDRIGCVLCYSGSYPGFLNKHDLGRVPEEVQANVQMFLGFAREKTYRQHPALSTCQVCGGETKVETGAKAGDYIVIPCDNCNGYGYTPPPGKSAPANGHQVTDAEHVAANLADLETPDRDNWGEPRVLPDGTLNANYGKMPQYKQVHPVYGVTSQLTPEELVLGTPQADG
jgi:hypothetical protein